MALHRPPLHYMNPRSNARLGEVLHVTCLTPCQTSQPPAEAWAALPAASAAVSSAASVARAPEGGACAELAAASEAAVEGMRPAALLWLPMWITPRRKVPVVMTSRLQRIRSPACAARSVRLLTVSEVGSGRAECCDLSALDTLQTMSTSEPHGQV